MSEIKLRLGDCLELLKGVSDESIDLILTDPPYGMGYQSNWVEKGRQKKKIANDKAPFVWWLYEAAKKIKSGGALICFCRWDSWASFSQAVTLCGLTVKSQIVWDKKNHSMGDLKGEPGNRHELAIFAVKGRFTFHGKRPQSLGAFNRCNPASMKHPNEKPVELMEWLVNHYCPANGRVLDCFMGVAPVGVAAKKTGRGYIGFELDAEYFEIAKQRIEAV